MNFVLIGNIFAFISLIISLVSRVYKKQSTSLIMNGLSNLVGLISLIFLSKYMGVAGLVVAITRAIVFYYYSKNNWDKKLWLLFLFIGLQFTACVMTSILDAFIWYNFALVFFKSVLYTYGAWQHDVKIFRIMSIISCVLSIVYFLIDDPAYINAVSELISIIILVVVMIKEHGENSKKLENKIPVSVTNN